MTELYKQFKEDKPETVGETDVAFDQSNYIDWLEEKVLELKDGQITLTRYWQSEKEGRERMRKLYGNKLGENTKLKEQVEVLKSYVGLA